MNARLTQRSIPVQDAPVVKDNALLRLPVDLYSPDQLSAIMLELHNYINTLRDMAARVKAGNNKVTDEPPHLSALLLGALHGAGITPGNRPAAEKLLKALEIVRAKAPVVHVTLAALPNRTLKRQLAVWFRTQVHQYTLLTFAMRSDIGGGVVVRAGSHIYDFSFRQRLIDNKQRISEIFEHVRQ